MKTIERVRKFGRQQVRRLGIDVTRVAGRPGLPEFLRSRDVDLVYDVGANVGQFGTELRQLGYRGRIVSFEPIGAVFRQLQDAARGDPKWETRQCALGAEAGTSSINVAGSTDFSSMLAPNPEGDRLFGGSVAANRIETISVATLDDTDRAFSASCAFLKIDTQGYEKQVLDGAKATLPRLAGVMMELPLVPIYEGVWSLSEAVTFMDAAGYAISQIHPNNLLPGDAASMIEIDCVFRRKNGLDHRRS